MNYRLLYLRGDLDRLPEPEPESEADIPDESLCPALCEALLNAQTVVEACKAMAFHIPICPVCSPELAVRRAA